MNDAATIARALGGHPSGGGYLCRCPLPSHGQGHGDRHPSLLIKDGEQAILLKCFGGCDAKDILGNLRSRGMVGEASDRGTRADVPPAEHRPEHKADPEALAIWNAGLPAANHPIVARYLAARGLTVAAPPSLRMGEGAYLDRYRFPALIAAVQAPDRRVIAVQVTLIDPRGDRKAHVRLPRKTTGALGWGAIRLGAAGDALGLAEGTEKGLAAVQLFGLPCWVSLGAGRMHRVWIPEAVRELHIFVDNDAAGRAAAERTAHEHRHRRVILRFPPEQFKDWDDVTQAQAKERSTAA